MPSNVDEYLEAVENESFRAALSELRSIIREVAPQAEERIAYGIPSYYLGSMLAGFAAFKHHCSFFPGHTVRDFADKLVGFKVGKGTIQFHPDRPIPPELVREILEARIHELICDGGTIRST